jgi:predicted O-methyltransferase YrrM
MYAATELEGTAGPVTLDPICGIDIRPGVAINRLVRAAGASRTLEVGFAYGFSTIWILDAVLCAADGRHVAIDPYETDRWGGVGIAQVAALGAGSRFDWIREHSAIALAALAVQGRRFDFAFINGGHRFDDVLVDFYFSDLMLEPGGLIAFDDATYRSVGTAINFVLANRAYVPVPAQAARLVVLRKLAADARPWHHFVPFRCWRPAAPTWRAGPMSGPDAQGRAGAGGGTVAAILMARNAAPTLGRLLAHMEAHEVPVVMVDHGSTDASRAIAAAYRGRPVVELIDEPYGGVFDLTRQLEVKRAIMARLDVDWIVHLDADEFLIPPDPGETLRRFIGRVGPDAEAIACMEYAFLPESEEVCHASESFVETMTAYVAVRNKDLKQRVFRRTADLAAWMRTGGHFVSEAAAAEVLRLDHYVGLSLDHMRAQYLGRVLATSDIARQWHYDRRAASAAFIVAPPPGALRDRWRDGLHADRPFDHLPVFASRGLGGLSEATVSPDADLVLACGEGEALAAAASAIEAALPGLRLVCLPAAARGLPVAVPLLHLLADGRRGLRGGAGAPRELAAAWCHFVGALRQEGLRVDHYRELRVEDLEAGAANLVGTLDALLGGDPETRLGFEPHRPERPAPPGLPAEAVRRFEAVAGRLLRDLGYRAAVA